MKTIRTSTRALALLLLLPVVVTGQSDELLLQLQSDDVKQRLSAIETLRQRETVNDRVLQGLAERINDDSADVAVAAIQAVAVFAPSEQRCVDLLAASLGDKRLTSDGATIGAATAAALADFGGKPGLDLLLKKVAGDDRLLQRAAAFGLANAGPRAKDAVPALIKMLKLNDSNSKQLALGALVEIGPASEPALPELLTTLEDRDFHVRYWSCRALGAIGPAAKAAAPSLRKKLINEVTSVRGNAASALGGIGLAGGGESVTSLIAALRDRHASVRVRAVVALGQFGKAAKLAADEVLKLLEHNDSELRVEAARTLALIGDHQAPARTLLVKELNELDRPWLAADALGDLGEHAQAAIPALVEALHAEDPETRLFAARSLGKLRAASAEQALEEARNDAVRAVADEALRALDAIQKSQK